MQCNKKPGWNQGIMPIVMSISHNTVSFLLTMTAFLEGYFLAVLTTGSGCIG